MNATRSLVLSALVLTAAACDNKATTKPPKSPATITQGDLTHASAAPTVASLPPGVDASVDTSALHVSNEIARACNLPRTESQASFAFDSSTIGEDDKTVLAAVARCMTEGALRGRAVSLIGRADPRGEDEYNMGLGETRSESVRKYLCDLGVEKTRLGVTSRGEIDATGTDEAGWAKDRRVDIELVN